MLTCDLLSQAELASPSYLSINILPYQLHPCPAIHAHLFF